jgi:hypothetical protein
VSSVWPWLVIAGTGALHGLNPCNAWVLVTAMPRSGRRWRWGRALVWAAFGAWAFGGARWMLVPALAPTCASGASVARAGSASLWLAAAALGVHLAAMLAVSACAAHAVSRLLALFSSRRAV